MGEERSLRDPAERVSPRARLMWTVGALLQAAVVVAVLLMASLAWGWLDLRWWWATAVVLVLAAYVVVVPRWRYAVHRWEITDTAVYTQTGWWTRERRLPPCPRSTPAHNARGP